MRVAAGKPVAQAFVALRAHDPEAVSALQVVQQHLPGGERLARLRRWRLLELRGELPPRGEIEDLLHRSTQFYNPAKERCLVRTAESEAAPLDALEQALLVTERGGERRPAAERWWRHETGVRVEVREGCVWGLLFEAGADPVPATLELAFATDRRRGLFANPHAQACKHASGTPPLRWLAGRGGALRPRFGGGAR